MSDDKLLKTLKKYGFFYKLETLSFKNLDRLLTDLERTTSRQNNPVSKQAISKLRTYPINKLAIYLNSLREFLEQEEKKSNEALNKKREAR